jgi:hypothetical protein
MNDGLNRITLSLRGSILAYFFYKHICKDYKDAKTMDDAETKYHVIRSWWLSSGAASEEGILGLSEWLGFWHFCYKQWGGHILLVSTYQTSLLNVIYLMFFLYLFFCVVLCKQFRSFI